MVSGRDDESVKLPELEVELCGEAGVEADGTDVLSGFEVVRTVKHQILIQRNLAIEN